MLLTQECGQGHTFYYQNSKIKYNLKKSLGLVLSNYLIMIYHISIFDTSHVKDTLNVFPINFPISPTPKMPILISFNPRWFVTCIWSVIQCLFFWAWTSVLPNPRSVLITWATTYSVISWENVRWANLHTVTFGLGLLSSSQFSIGSMPAHVPLNHYITWVFYQNYINQKIQMSQVI